MALKKPSELFEQRRLESLQKENVKEEELKKRIISPKQLFGEIVEIQEPSILEEIIEEPVDSYLEKIEELRNDLEKISYIIPEETDLTEVYQGIENLKNRIDTLPKQKSYSEDIQSLREELKRIKNSIPVPEVFDPSDLYNNISTLGNKLNEVRSEIPIVPEPILYDNQLDQLKEMVVNVRNSIPVVPEIRYYEPELNLIIDAIEQVHSEIPEIKCYDNEISAIESRLTKIQESIPTVRYYDDEIDILNQKIVNIKESIPIVPEVKSYDKDVKELNKKIDSVKKSIPIVPEIKSYDKDIKDLNKEVQELYKKVLSIKIPDQDNYIKEVKGLYSSFEDKNYRLLEKINYLEKVFEKFNQEIITEGLLNEPPEIKTSDSLTPLDQNFVTLSQLQEHYRIFINRIQQQLSTLGGGGAVRLNDLDDVDISGITANSILKWNSISNKWVITSLSSSSVVYSSEVIISGGTTSETLSNSNRTEEDVLIFVNGVFFTPTDDYTISSTTLNFSSAPIVGSKIVVKYLS